MFCMVFKNHINFGNKFKRSFNGAQYSKASIQNISK